MSWSDRRGVLAGLGAAALLPGCFRPMLAESEAAAALRGRIDLPDGRGRTSYHLRRRLESLLGTPRQPDHRLEVDLDFRERGLAISEDDSITRVTLTGTANWRLFRRGESGPVLAGREVSESGYNATGSLYAAQITRRDIERRLARDLAERVSRGILARADRVLERGAS